MWRSKRFWNKCGTIWTDCDERRNCVCSSTTSVFPSGDYDGEAQIGQVNNKSIPLSRNGERDGGQERNVWTGETTIGVRRTYQKARN